MKKTPIYKQIYKDIMQKIKNGELSKGDMLPTEKELQKTYQASRSPIRYALDLLEAKGYIIRTPGKGTEIIHPEIASWAKLSGFSSYYNYNLDKMTVKILSVDTVVADQEIADYFGFTSNRKVIRITRLRLIDGRPLALIHNHFASQMDEVIVDVDNENQTLVELLRSILNTEEVYVQEKLSAVKASKDVAKLLEVPIDDPVLFVTRYGFDHKKNPVEFTRYWALTDQMEYSTYFQLQ